MAMKCCFRALYEDSAKIYFGVYIVLLSICLFCCFSCLFYYHRLLDGDAIKNAVYKSIFVFISFGDMRPRF